ncbi:hypothetical protein KIN20_007938 [Parelaphostrongylus tenuis]|uniref:Uncharacterized protein n=1 Tax=Parelaphostrongylus tenuis TaxID=148309 RepID=A0AAD5QIA2_PARTN|nr:hypothetical protein KIN20_007938 [Parelaphostrongylus tenuis]
MLAWGFSSEDGRREGRQRYWWLSIHPPVVVPSVHVTSDMVSPSRTQLLFDSEKTRHAAQNTNFANVEPSSNLIVFYNRIPKTGSTTLTNAVAYDLFKINGFNVIHLNMTKNKQVMSLTDRSQFVNNITSWSERKPTFYHGHVAFIDFERRWSWL